MRLLKYPKLILPTMGAESVLCFADFDSLSFSIFLAFLFWQVFFSGILAVFFFN